MSETAEINLFTFVLGTFLCCAFSYRVLGKSDRTVVVTLQRILKPDTAQWFPGNTVDIKSQQRIQERNQTTKGYQGSKRPSCPLDQPHVQSQAGPEMWITALKSVIHDADSMWM